MSDSVLATALAFASRKHAVLPLWWPVGPDDKLVCACGRLCGKNAAKHPHGRLAPNGLHSATTNAGIIKNWWGYQVPEANLGVTTDKLVVIDIDPRHAGDVSLAAREREHGPLPHTWRSITGSLGQHILFACPDGVEIQSFSAENMANPPLGRGVDVRARRAYIVAVGSRHISGRYYEWSADHHPNDLELAPPPGWLVEKLPAAIRSPGDDGGHEPLSAEEWVKRLQPASEYPDDVACAIVGHLLARGCEFKVVLALLRPWPRENGLEQQKLERPADSIARDEADKRRKRLERNDA
jgi:hypothetical protein